MMMGLDAPAPGRASPFRLTLAASKKPAPARSTAAVGKVGATGPETHSGAMRKQSQPTR